MSGVLGLIGTVFGFATFAWALADDRPIIAAIGFIFFIGSGIPWVVGV